MYHPIEATIDHPGVPNVPATAKRHDRRFRDTLARRSLLLFGMFCVIGSALLLLAPLLPRLYSLSGTMDATVEPFPALPALEQITSQVIQDYQPLEREKGVTAAINGKDADGREIIGLSVTNARRDTALVAIQSTANRLSLQLRNRAEELADDYRRGLTQRQNKLLAQEATTAQEVESFRINHRGILPDDPTSVIAQFEKLTGRLDEKQQRLNLVSEQIVRLGDYKRKSKEGSGSQLALPVPLPRAEDSPAAPKVADDPEVISIAAQLQLINDQIDEQLNTLHRTEEHPYVKDLREKEAALQKKLEAAKQRVAAGRPPPRDIRAVASAPSDRGPDAALVALQEVDLQLESLQAEQTTLGAEVRDLKAQRDVMRKQVDDVMPARRAYETLTARLDATRKEKATVAAALQEFERRSGGSADGAGDSWIEVTPLATASSMLPTFPGLGSVYLISLGGSLMVVLLAAALLHRMDRKLHTPQEAGAWLDVPILGVTAEILSPGRRRMRQIWRGFGRPAMGLIFLSMISLSGVQFYRQLADPEYPANARRALTGLAAGADGLRLGGRS